MIHVLVGVHESSEQAIASGDARCPAAGRPGSTFLGILLLSLTWKLKPLAIGPERVATAESTPALHGGGA